MAETGSFAWVGKGALSEAFVQIPQIMIFLSRCLQVMAYRESHWVYSHQPTGEMV